MNSKQDPTFVRNRTAYGLFRSWGTAAAPRPAPDSRFAEVFMNGRYYGLFELAARVDEDLLDDAFAAARDPEVSRWIIYRHETLFPRNADLRVRRPTDSAGDFTGPAGISSVSARSRPRPTGNGNWAGASISPISRISSCC